MRKKIAISGSGAVAVGDYYPAFLRPDIAQKLEVTAICDVAPGRAEEHCRRFGFGKPYTDYDKMLSEAQIDIVAVLSPIPFHFEQTKKALLAGKHAYVQKTMTQHASEAIELNKLAQQRDLYLCASPGQMIEHAHAHALDVLKSGKMGKVFFVRGQAPHAGHERSDVDPAWYYKAGGGPMMDVAVYPLTSMTGLVGPAKRVSAFSGIVNPDRYWKGKKLDVEADDSTVLILDFGNNVFGSVMGNFCSLRKKTPQLELFCEKGTIYLGGWTDLTSPLEMYTEETVLGESGGWYAPILPANKLVWTVADLVHMVDCVTNGTKPRIRGDHVAHVIEIIEKSYESAKTGRAIPLETTFEAY